MLDLNAKIIKTGTCTIDPGKIGSTLYKELKNKIGIGGGSTVTIIGEEDELLLIDTGFEQESDQSEKNKNKNWNLLKLILEFNEISIEDITKVFITHFHYDHFGNIEFFKNAKWYCHEQSLLNFKDDIRDKFIPLKDYENVLKNTRVVYTPGHTIGHSSLLWSKEDEKNPIRIVISGDAIINLSWLQSGHIWRFNSDFYDADLAKKSIQYILDKSDIVIPGHGQPFFTGILTTKEEKIKLLR